MESKIQAPMWKYEFEKDKRDPKKAKRTAKAIVSK